MAVVWVAGGRWQSVDAVSGLEPRVCCDRENVQSATEGAYSWRRLSAKSARLSSRPPSRSALEFVQLTR